MHLPTLFDPNPTNTNVKPPLQQKTEINSLPRRKWITIVHPANVRWSSHSHSIHLCIYTKHRGNKKNYDSILCVSLNEIMTSAVGERGNLFHHDVAGLPGPLHNEMLCDLWPREREDSRNSFFSWKKFLLSNFQHQTHRPIEKLANCLYSPFLWFMLKGWVVYSLFACWRL